MANYHHWSRRLPLKPHTHVVQIGATTLTNINDAWNYEAMPTWSAEQCIQPSTRQRASQRPLKKESLMALRSKVYMMLLRASFPWNHVSVNRSPHLACPSGTIMTLYSTFQTLDFVLGLNNQPPYGVIFYEGSFSETWVQVLFLTGGPGQFLASIALIAWAIRLWVLYNPAKRKRRGHRTKEAVIFRSLAWSYAVIEAGAWLAVPFYGLQA